MQTIIKKLHIPVEKRIIAISDIHGHYEYFVNLLEKVHFCKNDILFIVGDITEKGPESLKTLRFVIKLCKEYTVYTLIGNVDAWRLELFDDNTKKGYENLYNSISSMKKHWGNCLFNEMCDELNINIKSIDDIPQIRQQLQIHFREEFDFLRSLPTIIETQKFIFVHGGIPTDNLETLVNTNAYTFIKSDAFMEKGINFNKYVIVGHWPVTLYNDKISSHNPIINPKQKIISIDGGCVIKFDGQLNALIIPYINTKEFSYAAYDSLPIVTAKTAQNVSEESINIRYTDNKIKLIEHGDEFSYIEHISTGYRLWIHNDYINDYCENTTCSDFTDYRLSVKIGDRLSVVKKTSKGYLVKKEGISGWYCGEVKSI